MLQVGEATRRRDTTLCVCGVCGLNPDIGPGSPLGTRVLLGDWGDGLEDLVLA